MVITGSLPRATTPPSPPPPPPGLRLSRWRRRKFGLYLMVSTRRPQKIAENVLSQADNLVLMRLNPFFFLPFLFLLLSSYLIYLSLIFLHFYSLISLNISPYPLLLFF